MRRRPLCARLLPSWLAQECELGRSYFDGAGTLYESWRRFAHGQRAEPGSTAEFAQAMEARCFACDRLQGERGRIRWGVRLRKRSVPPC